MGDGLEVSIGGFWHCWTFSLCPGVWMRAAVVAAVFWFGTEAWSSHERTRELTWWFLRFGVTSWTWSWETSVQFISHPVSHLPLHCFILPCPSSPGSLFSAPLNLFFRPSELHPQRMVTLFLWHSEYCATVCTTGVRFAAGAGIVLAATFKPTLVPTPWASFLKDTDTAEWYWAFART
jgi:hypothetical protein